MSEGEVTIQIKTATLVRAYLDSDGRYVQIDFKDIVFSEEGVMKFADQLVLVRKEEAKAKSLLLSSPNEKGK